MQYGPLLNEAKIIVASFNETSCGFLGEGYFVLTFEVLLTLDELMKTEMERNLSVGAVLPWSAPPAVGLDVC